MLSAFGPGSCRIQRNPGGDKPRPYAIHYLDKPRPNPVHCLDKLRPNIVLRRGGVYPLPFFDYSSISARGKNLGSRLSAIATRQPGLTGDSYRQISGSIPPSRPGDY